ncbi:MAG: hypothetical protein ACI37Q_07310 [Candidatus Gastranaerophilaceae bacterium]
MKQNNKNQKNINIFNYIPKKYSSYVFDATTKYQKKYGFDIGTGERATWDNEADAFHTYMQSIMANRYGTLLANDSNLTNIINVV